MWLNQLKIFQFKNFESKNISCKYKFNALIGNNGSGKSSILDAVHYLCLTKSFFIPNDFLNINFSSDFFTIEGTFEKENQEQKIKLSFQKGQKKILKINEKAYPKLADHIGKLPVVVISPYDNNLILQGSEERRKFIDNVLSQPDYQYLNYLIQYNKIIQQRNFLLKTFLQKGYFDQLSLDIYNEPLIKYGNYIYEKRKKFSTEFLIHFKEYYQKLSQNPSEIIDIKYESQFNDYSFNDLLNNNLEKDRKSGFTCSGIHKDDLIFNLYDFPIKKIGSQGQQKTFLIALKLAQYQYIKENIKEKPILLLDDIFDKLDEKRVSYLLHLVNNDEFGQVFISHTKKEELINATNFIDKINLNIIEI